MDRFAQLQFSVMAPDAQRAAIRRLALRGFDDTEIAQATGWTQEQVRAVLEPWGMDDGRPLPLLRNWRSGSPGGSPRL